MKFALINGNKTEAVKGVKGICPVCEKELIARCGDIKVHHWAHKGRRHCDQWWENETEWHRLWKGKFPIDWQEVVHIDGDSGEKHIADVITESEWVLEFQHSYLKPEERRSRNAFYQNIVWVVDGLRRKRDITQFKQIVEDSKFIIPNYNIRKGDCSLNCVNRLAIKSPSPILAYPRKTLQAEKLSDSSYEQAWSTFS